MSKKSTKIIKEGYVYKRSKNVPHKWQRRYMILTQNGLIKYAKNKSTPYNNGFIISHIKSIFIDKYNAINSRWEYIIKTESRKWVFALENEKQRNDWILIIKQMMQIHNGSNKIDKLSKQNSGSMNNKLIKHNEMEIINELVLMKKYDEAQVKFETLLTTYPNWEILNENYEYFLANYVNKPELAQNNFISRVYLLCLPKDMKINIFKKYCTTFDIGYWSTTKNRTSNRANMSKDDKSLKAMNLRMKMSSKNSNFYMNHLLLQSNDSKIDETMAIDETNLHPNTLSLKRKSEAFFNFENNNYSSKKDRLRKKGSTIDVDSNEHKSELKRDDSDISEFKEFNDISKTLFLKVNDGELDSVKKLLIMFKNKTNIDRKYLYTLKEIEIIMDNVFEKCLGLRYNSPLRVMYTQMQTGNIASLNSPSNDSYAKNRYKHNRSNPLIANTDIDTESIFDPENITPNFGILGNISQKQMDVLFQSLNEEQLQLQRERSPSPTTHVRYSSTETNSVKMSISGGDSRTSWSNMSNFLDGSINCIDESFFPIFEAILDGEREYTEYSPIIPQHIDGFSLLCLIWQIRAKHMNHIVNSDLVKLNKFGHNIVQLKVHQQEHHKMILVKTLTLLYSYVYEIFRGYAPCIDGNHQIRDKFKRYRERTLTLFNMADENDPFGVRLSLINQLLSLVGSMNIAVQDKQAIIQFLSRNDWINSLPGKDRSKLLLSLEHSLRYELGRMSKHFEDCFADITDDDLKTFKRLFRVSIGRVVFQQNDHEVLGDVLFLNTNVTNQNINKLVSNYNDECKFRYIEPLKSAKYLIAKNDIGTLYLDYILKIAYNIKPYFNDTIKAYLSYVCCDIKYCNIKPKNIILAEMKKANNKIRFINQSLDIVKCYCVFSTINDMIKGLNILESLSRDKSSNFRVCHIINHINKYVNELKYNKTLMNDIKLRSHSRIKTKANQTSNGNETYDIRSIYDNYKYISIYCIIKLNSIKFICEIRFILESLWFIKERYMSIVNSYSNILTKSTLMNICRCDVNINKFETFWDEEIKYEIQ